MYGVTYKTVYASMERLGVDTPTGRHEGCPAGDEHWNWKGGRVVDDRGCVRIYKPEHLQADFAGYVLEHRLVMERHLGRPLSPSEFVYHKNGIKDDNRISNLDISTAPTNTNCVRCPFCQKEFLIRRDNPGEPWESETKV